MESLEQIEKVSGIFVEMRTSADEHFQKIFEKASHLTTITVPRICSKQTKRANIPAENAEEYYRRTIFIPILDDIIEQMNERYETAHSNSSILSFVLPRNCNSESSKEKLEEAFKFFRQYFLRHSLEQAKGEFDVWCALWKGHSDKPYDAISALKKCDKNAFPVVNMLLVILASQPVSTASPERAFSNLRRLKTWLRSTMGQERLTSLALMATHPERLGYNDAPKILELFALKKSRRIDLIL